MIFNRCPKLSFLSLQRVESLHHHPHHPTHHTCDIQVGKKKRLKLQRNAIQHIIINAQGNLSRKITPSEERFLKPSNFCEKKEKEIKAM